MRTHRAASSSARFAYDIISYARITYDRQTKSFTTHRSAFRAHPRAPAGAWRAPGGMRIASCGARDRARVIRARGAEPVIQKMSPDFFWNKPGSGICW